LVASIPSRRPASRAGEDKLGSVERVVEDHQVVLPLPVVLEFRAGQQGLGIEWK
jgi:hypothetical protein